MRLGFAPGTRVALLSANRADTWCAGVAAQLSRLAITWLHPLGSLDDQLFQIEDSEAEMLVIDADHVPRPRRRSRRQGKRRENRLHHGPRQLRQSISCGAAKKPAALPRAALQVPTISRP